MNRRSGEKGERDLLVALGLMVVAGEPAIVDLERAFGELDGEQRHTVLSNLTVLSLLRPHRQMPDPERHRQLVARVAARLAAAST